MWPGHRREKGQVGATTLVSMCWDHQATIDECGEAPGQTGTAGAALMARDARVERLVLVHRGPRLEGAESECRVLAAVARAFDGDVVLADELDIVDLWWETEPGERR